MCHAALHNQDSSSKLSDVDIINNVSQCIIKAYLQEENPKRQWSFDHCVETFYNSVPTIPILFSTYEKGYTLLTEKILVPYIKGLLPNSNDKSQNQSLFKIYEQKVDFFCNKDEDVDSQISRFPIM